MRLVAGFSDLWEIPANECGLAGGLIFPWEAKVYAPL